MALGLLLGNFSPFHIHNYIDRSLLHNILIRYLYFISLALCRRLRRLSPCYPSKYDAFQQ